ncbi:hypothetical protein D3C87_62590 [compost metagenome]
MKKAILIVLLLVSCPAINAQQFDNKLNNFRAQIVRSFKEYGEIPNKEETDSLQYKYLYSRRLAAINSRTIYYEIGRMTDHGYKFLALYHNGRLTVFPSKNFNAEFIEIIMPLEDTKAKRTNYFRLFRSIKEMYDYNTNPPWLLNLELKN